MDFESLKKAHIVEDVVARSKKISKIEGLIIFVILTILGLLITGFVFSRAPSDFPEKHIFSLKSGSTLRDVSTELAENNIIKSPQLLEVYIMVTGNKSVIAGDYLFDHPQSVTKVARRITNGDYGDSHIRVVLHEGTTVEQMAEVLEENFENFNKSQFLRLAKNKEGYLFPDTYFFFPSMGTKEIFDTLTEAFDSQIAELEDDIVASGRSLEEIITMASIIEKESGNNMTERKIISGILWKRIRIGMPLQVDAPFVYIIGKGSDQLTHSDLKEDSPYNTYTNKGLPPGPIGNPGLASIKAAIYPTESEFLFYLHGNDGMVRYARNFDEHVLNKNTYLR